MYAIYYNAQQSLTTAIFSNVYPELLNVGRIMHFFELFLSSFMLKIVIIVNLHTSITTVTAIFMTDM